MSRILLVGVLVTLALGAWPAIADGQAEDRAYGSGDYAGAPGYSIAFDVRSDPSGASASGRLEQFFCGQLFIRADITCLAVNGSDANMSGVITGGAAFPLGGPVYFRTRDGGTGGVDEISATYSPPAPVAVPPGTCVPQILLDLGLYQVANGSVVVIDAPKLPTATSQCKNGGWQTYGIFKNQGDCVSFVATGGKNPPANSP
jgi:hypothetical protein